MLVELFGLLFIISLGALIFAWIRKHWLVAMGSTIMFLVLAFNSFNLEVVSNGLLLSMSDPTFIYISWGLAFISFITVLIGAIGEMKEKRNENEFTEG